MVTKINILFLIPTLETGGSQKVLSVLLKNISKEKFDVTLCTLTGTGRFYDTIPDRIKKINLEISRVRYSALKTYQAIKKSNPDVVFVFDVNNLNLIVGILSLFLPSRIKYITRQSVVLSCFIESYPYFRRLRKFLYKFTFRRFQKIICQSDYMQHDIIKHFNVRSESIQVVNNPIEVDNILAASITNESLLKPQTLNIIAVGRIVYVKGFDLLMEALNFVTLQNFHLTILGDKTPESPGYEEHVLGLVKKYNLFDKVSFLGFTVNPHKYVRQSDLLVIPSRTEAFSNVAIEANAVGTPVLAFDSPGGMSEIILEGFNGWLIENGNVEKLASAIDRIATLHIDRNEVAAYSRKKYDVSKIIPQYEKLIADLLKSGK